MTAEYYGKLIIMGKEGGGDLEFPLDKKSVLIGRDHGCDIRLINKEISRKHAELYVGDSGKVFVSSMGREPVSVNSTPVLSPLELASGDKIEVHLEGRSRVFFFHGAEDIRQLGARPPLGQLNALTAAPHQAAAKAAKDEDAFEAKDAARMPPPPPPPMPAAAKAAALPPPPMPSKAGAAAPSAGGGMSAALRDAIKSGVQLRKTAAAEAPAPSAGMFVPNASDLRKLKAGLRNTQREAQVAPQSEVEPVAVGEVKAEPAAGDVEMTQALAVGEVEMTQALAFVEEEEGVAAAEDEEAAARTRDDLTAAVVAQLAAAVEEALGGPARAAAAAAPGSTAAKARKSVRFDSTPEGAPREAALTIRLRKGDLEQVVTVEDNTVAFSAWALGSLAGGAAADEGALPDTVVSRRSRRESVAPATGGEGSVRKTPVAAALQGLFSDAAAVRMTPLGGTASAAKGATPGCPGARAPAPTPTTAARPAGGAQLLSGDALNAASLAAKLAELAEDHDFTFDLPADFMRFTPGAGRKTISVVMTPRSAAPRSALKPAAAPPATAEASAAKSAPPRSATKSAAKSAGRSRLGQAFGEAAAAGELLTTEEVEQEGSGEQGGAGEVQQSSGGPVAAAGSARRPARRASMRTPGTKIAIIARGTPRAGASSVKPPSRPPATVEQPARGASSQHTVGDGSDQEMPQAAEAEGAAAEAAPVPCAAPPSTLAMRCCDAEDEEEAGGESGGERARSAGAVARGASPAAAAPAGATVPLVALRRAVLKARTYRTQSRQLAAQLRGVAARASRLRRAAASLAEALQAERGMRAELQEALQRIAANDAAAEAEAEDVLMEEEQEAVEEEEAVRAPRVVVVGYNPAPAPCHVELCGSVVVVRPAGPAPAPPAAKTPAKTPATGRTTPAPVRSARKTPAKAPGTGGGAAVRDVDVLPAWVFEAGGGGADVAAELAEVASAGAAEAAERRALQAIEVEQQAAQADEEAEEAAAAEDEADDGEDACHVCGAGDEGDVLLLCDSCDNACHLACCAPPLKRVPKGDWFCVECAAARQAAPAPKKAAAKRATKSAAPEAETAAKPAAPKRGRAAAAKVPAAEEGPKPKRGRAAATPAKAPAKAPARASRARK